MAVTLKGSYTVVGYWSDTYQAFAHVVAAVTVEDAYDQIARGWGEGGNLVIIGAVPVQTELIPTHEDGRTSLAGDLRIEEEDESWRDDDEDGS